MIEVSKILQISHSSHLTFLLNLYSQLLKENDRQDKRTYRGS